MRIYSLLLFVVLLTAPLFAQSDCSITNYNVCGIYDTIACSLHITLEENNEEGSDYQIYLERQPLENEAPVLEALSYSASNHFNGWLVTHRSSLLIKKGTRDYCKVNLAELLDSGTGLRHCIELKVRTKDED